MNRKAVSLPINIVVMMIIGIIIFSLGLSLFFQISGDAENTIEDLNGEIKMGISRLECDGEDWVCSPSYEIRNGERETFLIYVSNRGDSNERYRIELNLENVEDAEGVSNDDGSILIQYATGDANVLSGESASFPFTVNAARVARTPTSFITTATLYDSLGEEVDKTPVIIKVR